MIRDEKGTAEETKRGETAHQRSIPKHLGLSAILTMLLVCLEAGRPQAARPEQTSFASGSALSQMEIGEQRQLLATLSKELHDTDEKCSLLGQRVNALECQLDDAKSELEKLARREASVDQQH